MKSAICCLLALVVTFHVAATCNPEKRAEGAQGEKKKGGKKGAKKDGKKRDRRKGRGRAQGRGRMTPQQVRQMLLRRFDGNKNGAIEGNELNQLAVAVHQLMQRGQQGPRGRGGRGQNGGKGQGGKKKKRR